MKYLIILIAASLLVIAGCGTTVTTSDPIAPPADTGDPIAPPADTGLTSDEQYSLDFIVEHTPELDQIADQQNKAVTDMSALDFENASTHIDTYVAHWNKIKSEWEAFPAAGGKVATLERLFETAANDLKAINTGLMDVLNGDDPNGDGAIAGIEAYFTDKAILDNELASFDSSY